MPRSDLITVVPNHLQRKFVLLINAIITLGCLLIDYYSKQWILNHYPWGVSCIITDFFNIELVANPGVAFSWFARLGGWTIVGSLVIAVVVTFAIITSWLQHLSYRNNTNINWLFNIASAVLLGGIWGNALDRWCYGAVIDFIVLHWSNRWYFPIFNVADIWITLGAGLLLWVSVKNETGYSV